MDIKSAGLKLNHAMIDALESNLGFRLPVSYRSFLVKNNGGSPSIMMVIDILGIAGSSTDIHEFLGFNQEIESSNVLWNYFLVKDGYPSEQLLPIAGDSGGSLFCLNLASDEEDPTVVFCDITDHKVYFVARNFDHFLSKIYEYSDQNS
jgi:hypothetical protein